MIKKIIISAGVLCCSSVQALNYLYPDFLNAQDDFNYPQLTYWQIDNIDQYVADEFFPAKGDVLVGIKPALISMMTLYDPSVWLPVETNFNNALFSGQWFSGPLDRYITGDYTGNKQAEILAVAPNGLLNTIQADTQIAGHTWHSLHKGGSEISFNDTLLSGDFNGSGKDEVLFIQPTHGRAGVVSLNQQPFAWSALNRTWNGAISLWQINQSDTYVVGDFNGDSKDELLAINTNGITHTMGFINNNWTFLLGSANNYLGSWDITVPGTHYLAIDFDNDGEDELIAINPNTGLSHILKMTGTPTQWQSISDNDGTGFLSDQVRIYFGDKYLEYNNRLLKLSLNGQVTLLKR